MAGYYWHSIEKIKMPDGIRAGIDKDGGYLYVGRAFHNGDLLPAKVVPNHHCAYVAWGGKEHKKIEYEILCKRSCTVIWEQAKDGAVPPGAIPVGFTSDDEKLYVGRVFHDGTQTPGKVHPSHGVCYIPYGGSEIGFSSYEVLILQ
ncbi:uncharacterized protein LOC126318327 [Schistocerca gregaria]|uniref:uncharacterized protein LOC126318327 n=1 Tax=Schistocerca gregaria TaxID=7010 RepID=UPI00211E8968|nr:uncharacterized protein LOC126318327 [Schistocerca gregaria]